MTPTGKNEFGVWLLLVIVEVPELSVLEGSGHVITFPGTPKSTVSSMLLGQPKICGGTSSTARKRKEDKCQKCIKRGQCKSEKNQVERSIQNG